MKCEVYLELLEEYLDGELAAESQEQVGAHLITCAGCSSAFVALTAEQELFARYDREVEVPPFLWTRIAAHTVSASDARPGWRARIFGFFGTGARSFASVIAVLLLAIAIGVVYWVTRQPEPKPVEARSTPEKINPTLPRNGTDRIHEQGPVKPDAIASNSRRKPNLRPKSNRAIVDQSDVLSSDLGYLDMDERDTAKHIEQTQNLLRSIRNFPVSDGDEEIDVTYDKALSRRLLNENVVLRRDAEMKAKFPTKTLLADLEPFLLDIANLPDHARPEDVRVIKERVQKTEIVAALLDYQDRGTNNR